MMRLILWRMVQLLVIVLAITVVPLLITLNPARCAPRCRGANLAGSSLNGAALRGTNLVQARLTNAALERADLSSADLSGANVVRASLIDANLSGAVLVGSDLSGSDMRGAALADADLSGANLSGANLTKVDLRGAVSLHGVLLENALLVEAQLAGVDLSGAGLGRANLTSADLSGANLSGANLSGATLTGADLRQADLSGALLNLADLSGANLAGARLTGATLIGSFAASASFNEANLSGATAIGANFSGADMRNATITGVRFLESDITDLDLQIDPQLAALNKAQIGRVVQNAQLEGVRFDDTVVWSPDEQVTLEGLLGVPLPAPLGASPSEVGGVELGPVDPAQQRGPLAIAGSTTAFPIVRALADQFVAAGFPGQSFVEASDTSPGLARLCRRGDIDLASASRLIDDEERAACTTTGRTPIAFRIGSDAIVVVVHPSNDFITDASIEELRRIFTVEQWSQINPRWPRRPIERFVPTATSGTRTFFEQTVGLSNGELELANNTTTNPDPAALARALAEKPYGVGILSYATFQQYSDQLQTISIEGVVANFASVNARRYLLARPLLLYSHATLLQRRPQLAAFVAFALQNAAATSQRTGYFPPSEAALQESAEALVRALGQSGR